jgi:hypothetical protein
MLHQWESVLLELTATLKRPQELEKLHAQLQNDLGSLKMTAKAEDKMFIQLLREFDSLKTIVEVQDKQDAHSYNGLDSVREGAGIA